MSTPSLTYYFSTGSRYSYLSMAALPEIELQYHVEFEWVPVNGQRMRQLRGLDPVVGPLQSGQYDWAYREQDAKAWANYYGIPFVEPASMEFDVELLLRGVLAAARQGHLRPYAWALAQEVYAKGTWPLDAAVTEQVAQDLELDLQVFVADRDATATQQQLENNCAQAVSRGAFGTPSLFIDETLFWGNDRLPLVRHELASRGLGAYAAQASGHGAEQADNNAHPLFNVVGLDHVVLVAQQPLALVEFYQALLNAPLERTVGDFLWQLRVGDSLLDIMRAKEPASTAVSGGAPNMDHYCLRVTPFNENAILEKLTAAGVEARSVGRIYGAQGFGPSIYFTDPAGNRVELKQHRH